MNAAQLSARIHTQPRVRLGTLPTPLMASAGDGGLLIKRDDLTGIGSGGNKIRPLEFLLGKALSDGCDSIIASGPPQSNLCTAARAMANRLHLPSVLFFNGEEPRVRTGNVLLNSLLGGENVFLGAVGQAKRESAVQARADALRSAGHRPFVVENGASTGRGALGYALLAAELLCQYEALGLSPGHVYLPVGNGGIAAGFIYGNALLGMPFTVKAVSVEDPLDVMLGHVERIISDASSLLDAPLPCALSEAAVFSDDCRGAGWGENTAESERAVYDFAAGEGIFVENVYTSKVLVKLAADRKSDAVRKNSCYLHTGGFGALFSQYQSTIILP